MVEDAGQSGAGRRHGGLKQVREGGWRVDVELPRAPGERRRRVSKTVLGTEADALRALDLLVEAVRSGPAPVGNSAPKRKSSPRRPRHSGAITELGPDRWLVGVEGEADPLTKERRRHTRTVRGSREHAEAELARLKLTVNGGQVPVATRARTVRSACDVYLAEARTEAQTRRTDRSACNRICATVLPGGRVVGDLPLSKISWKEVEQIFAKWEGAIVPTTRARYASSLSKVFEHAKRSGWLRSNPVADAARPRVPSSRPNVPPSVDVRDALRRAKSSDFEFYAYVTGLASVGCRRSELLAITVGDLDLEAGVVTIRASISDGGPGIGTYRKTTKKNDWRDVPLTEQMVEVFRELIERRTARLAEFGKTGLDPDGYVFSDDPDGIKEMRPDSTSHRWLAARGSSPVTFAMLRRYVSTELLDVTNGDYRTVAAITGNSEETLRRWYDAGPNLQKKQAVIKMSCL